MRFVLTENIVWKLFSYQEKKRKKDKTLSVLQIAETLRQGAKNAKTSHTCNVFTIKTSWNNFVSYNKITKLTIPQKTSENIVNLHIDLFSNTLPVDLNDKKVRIHRIMEWFSIPKDFHSLPETYTILMNQLYFWLRKAWNEPLFHDLRVGTEPEGVELP